VPSTATGGPFGKRLREFLSSPDLILLAQVGQIFGRLPSEILERGALAWQIDAAAAIRLRQWENEQLKQQTWTDE
jgi:hypothetical protein